jgi:hypothetical protein
MSHRSDRAKKHRPHPLSRAEFGRRAGRARSSVTEACAGPLAAACLSGGRIDAAHPDVAVWAGARGIDPAVLVSPLAAPGAVRTQADGAAPSNGSDAPQTPPTRARIAPPAPPINGPEDVTDLYGWTFGRVLDVYGSSQAMGDWLAARKVAAEIAKLELMLATTRADLIPREAVRTHVFGLIDGTFRRLLQDSPKTIARRVYAMANAGEPAEKAEELVRDTISSVLRPIKEGAARTLRAPSASAAEEAA